MVTCIACEDWFHESCLNLQPRPEPREDVDDDEDEESDCLIPSDSYDGLICAECAKLHPLLAERSGTDGWMIIEPHDKEGEWKVVGKKMAGSKRANEEDCGSDPKRARVEDAPAESDHPTVVSAPPVEADGVVPTETAEAVAPVPAAARKGAGDIFLAHGIREELKAQLDVSHSLSSQLTNARLQPPRHSPFLSKTRRFTSLPKTRTRSRLWKKLPSVSSARFRACRQSRLCTDTRQ